MTTVCRTPLSDDSPLSSPIGGLGCAVQRAVHLVLKTGMKREAYVALPHNRKRIVEHSFYPHRLASVLVFQQTFLSIRIIDID
jgi:hypothetical protein